MEYVSVVGGRPDLFWNAQVLRQRVHLRLVKVGDRLHVRRSVSQLHEEALVVLQPVRRSGDGVVEPVRVVVLGHLAHPLLEVGRGDDPQVGLPGEPVLGLSAVRGHDDDREQAKLSESSTLGSTIFDL
jgi:hypothetical protein